MSGVWLMFVVRAVVFIIMWVIVMGFFGFVVGIIYRRRKGIEGIYFWGFRVFLVWRV